MTIDDLLKKHNIIQIEWVEAEQIYVNENGKRLLDKESIRTDCLYWILDHFGTESQHLAFNKNGDFVAHPCKITVTKPIEKKIHEMELKGISFYDALEFLNL